MRLSDETLLLEADDDVPDSGRRETHARGGGEQGRRHGFPRRDVFADESGEDATGAAVWVH
jgi:hypothetical protein